MSVHTYAAQRAALFEGYQSTTQHSYSAIKRFHHALTTLCDGVFTQIWNEAGLESEPTCALLATGGYGRAALYPHSDLDILVLLSEEANALLEEKVGAFLNACWDAGLNVSSSVRSIEACVDAAKGEITIQTTLQESRLLCGNGVLAERMQQALRAALDVDAFVTAKLDEMHARHVRYDETAYALEPNCKESPGGLRDLHTILWVARAHDLGTSWLELHQNGLITEHEYLQLRRHWAKLAWIRTRLHWLTGRDENRLLFMHQTELAHSFNYKGVLGETPLTSHKASEVLMRRYYWSAKAVQQLRDIVLMSMYERIRKKNVHSTQGFELLGDGFVRRDDLLDLTNPDLYHKRSQAILETFYLFSTHPKIQRLAAQTLRALFNARPIMGAAFRADAANKRMFMRILQAPSGHTHTFRLMNNNSVLGRYLWAFRRVVGQMQHDLFHVYTVDQHTLMVLRNMRRFFISKHDDEHPLCSELAQQWDKPWLMYVACLFHDIGKGRGGDHSEIGAAEVAQFCEDHGINSKDTDTLVFLVKAHLLMSKTAQKQDISDPVVVRAFADVVGSEERLTALYLLTVADVKGTNPTAWNSWKDKLFEDLYRATLRALGGFLGDADTEIQRKKNLALQQMAAQTLPAGVEQKLWKNVDKHYFLRHDSSDIAWHAKHVSKALYDSNLRNEAHAEQALVRCRLPNRVSPSYSTTEALSLQIMVYTPDRADCFAYICAYLHDLNCNILDAKIYTTGDGYALDTFQVINPDSSVHAREMMGLIEQGLPRYLAQTDTLPAAKQARLSSRARVFPASSTVELQPNKKQDGVWEIALGCNDRMGLLFNIARVFAQYRLDILAAKISTLGERVEDVFEVKGEVLETEAQRDILRDALLDAMAH